MKRLAFALALTAAASLVMFGCSDVGDSSVGPAEDAQSPAVDGSLPEASSGGDGTVSVVDSGADSTVEPGPDAQTNEASAADVAVPPDSNAEDASDGATGDSSLPDSAPADAGEEAGSIDAGQDSSPGIDASHPADAGIDAGTIDAGTNDAGVDSGIDAGGADTGTDAGSPLVPCTTAGQTGCVQCDNSAGNLCSPTEAALVARDIAKGYATAPGPEPSSACYECLAQAGQLDDTSGDTGNECGDAPNPAECLATLNCILGSECAATAVNICYCGTAAVSSSCNAVGAGNAANGTCATQIAAGLGFAVNDGHDILANLDAKHLSSGIADKIFQDAISNTCATCQQ